MGGPSGDIGTAAAATEFTRWLSPRVVRGRILTIGAGDWSSHVDLADIDLIPLDELAASLTHRSLFEQAWLGEGVVRHDLARTLLSVYDALKPGGSLLLAVPFGRGLYLSSVTRLVEQLCDIRDIDVVGPSIVVSATRRADASAPAMLALSTEERAFNAHEQRLHERADELRRLLVQSGERYRGLQERLSKVDGQLTRATQELATARRKLDRLRPYLAVPLALLRGVRRLRARRTEPVAAVVPEEPTTLQAGAEPTRSPAVEPPPDWRSTLRERFASWLDAARAATGDEVVLMFSGTTFVQQERGNRPIRLTHVYLNRQSPVFFNYYRWRDTEPLPDYTDPLLFQSPIDATAEFLDSMLRADFGDKRKLFFASFPHELMVRYLTLAAQHGWVTIYDARDDWEEFAKVGMAKWYHPGYERYVATHADIVTAVSAPLARKMSVLAGGRVTHVNANGLDPRFPRPQDRDRDGDPPIVGYFGHLTDKWFDWPLVISAAKRYPEYCFELAGHQAPKLDLPANVRLLGLLNHDQIAERSRHWSMAVIPFQNGPLADAVDPIKIYEYLHLGLPVLTTYFPQCRHYPGTVITESRDEFLDRLPELIGSTPDEREVRDWLAVNTWECRADAYTALAAEVTASGRPGLMALLGEAK